MALVVEKEKRKSLSFLYTALHHCSLVKKQNKNISRKTKRRERSRKAERERERERENQRKRNCHPYTKTARLKLFLEPQVQALKKS